jgi:hypothetical protein
MWGGLGGAETTRGRRLVLNIQGCPGNASPKPKSGLLLLLLLLRTPRALLLRNTYKLSYYKLLHCASF